MTPTSYRDDYHLIVTSSGSVEHSQYEISTSDCLAQLRAGHETSNSDNLKTQPTFTSSVPTRRTARQTKKPQWMSDYVIAAAITQNKIVYAAANQVSYTHLNTKYQAFLSAVDKQ